MADQNLDIATEVVEMVTQHKGAGKWELTEKELLVLTNLVFAAGFESQMVVPGILYGWNVDQDGSKLDQYQFNHFPYKVIASDGTEDFGATGWLQDAVNLVSSVGYRGDRTLVEQLIHEIDESVPLKPIQLTREGDFLREYPPRPHELAAFNYFVKHTRDDGVLSSCVGIHSYCGGWVDRHGATATQHALVCRACGLRIYFPKGIRTYGDLRQYLEKQFAQTTESKV